MTDLLHETETSGKTRFDYVGKVRALLEQAQRATDEETRNLFQSKAMKLSARHGITDAMLGDSGQLSDDIGQTEFDFTGVLAEAQRELSFTIASVFGGKAVISDLLYRKPKAWRITITGWKTDLARVEVLNTSLQLQCVTARKEWERDQKGRWEYMTRYDRLKDQRTFILGYARAVRVRLEQAYAQAIRDAAAERAGESKGAETEKDAMTGVALALRSRKDAVAKWYDDFYGNGLKTSRGQRATGSWSAHAAGTAAGMKADVGQQRVGGGYRAIGG